MIVLNVLFEKVIHVLLIIMFISEKSFYERGYLRKRVDKLSLSL